jgi:cold shock CspA family protein
MRYGTVVEYFAGKGFGFIRPDAGQDVFFHITALGACEKEPIIQPGQPVKYELMPKTETGTGEEGPVSGSGSSAQRKKGQRRARLVELIDRIPGASLEDTPQHRKARHPRSLRKKPTWRR